jgi:hypothetical protein
MQGGVADWSVAALAKSEPRLTLGWASRPRRAVRRVGHKKHEKAQKDGFVVGAYLRAINTHVAHERPESLASKLLQNTTGQRSTRGTGL